MDLKTAQGKTIRLPAEFFSGSQPTDPEEPRVVVLDPASRPVLVVATPQREEIGRYYFEYEVAPNAPVGIWTVRWTCRLDGLDVAGEDAFEVTPALADRGLLAGQLAAAVAPARSGGRTEEQPRQLEASPGGALAPAAASGPLARIEPGDSPEPPAARGRKRRKPRPVRSRVKESTDEALADPDEGVTRRRGRVSATKGNTRLAGALLICLIGVGFVANQASKDNPTQAEQSFRLAEQALKGGALDQARSHYLDIVLEDPENTIAYFDLGMLAHFQNRVVEAQDFYMRALKRDPTFLPALYNLAILKDNSGRVDEAILLYRQILKKSPEHAASNFNLGLILYNKKGDPQEGRRLIEEAVRLDPTLAARASEAFGTPIPGPAAPAPTATPTPTPAQG